jgi:hypothetical protein
VIDARTHHPARPLPARRAVQPPARVAEDEPTFFDADTRGGTSTVIVSGAGAGLFELLQLRSAPSCDRRFLGFVALALCGLGKLVRPKQ